jgi:Spy/CpxP family protein refolding chaperone
MLSPRAVRSGVSTISCRGEAGNARHYRAIATAGFTQLYAADKPVQRVLVRLRPIACAVAGAPMKEHEMSQETNETKQPDSGKPRRPWRRIAIATLIGGLAAGAGITAFAHGGHFGGGFGPGGWHMGPGGQMDPEAMKRRVDASVRWMLADINATEAQQARIADIVGATAKEMAPLREKHREARRSVIELLAKPNVDRAALEAIRAQEIQAADAMSKRFVQSLADVAEVLTPEQRAQLAEKMKQRREHRRRG